MDKSQLDEFGTELQGVPRAAALADLTTRKFVVVNDAAATLYGVPSDELVGSDAVSWVHPSQRAAAARALADMNAGVIDGYQVKRRIVRADAKETEINIWGRRISAADRVYALWVLLEDGGDVAGTGSNELTEVVLAITDHDWQLEYVSVAAPVLGAEGSALVGTPLLGLVHPSTASEFLAAATRASSHHIGITVAARLRAGPDRWADRNCLVVPMCVHDPPRLGIVISDGPPWDAGVSVSAHVQHAAIEVRAAEALKALPAVSQYGDPPELSARQVEILSRLIAGDGVEEIANALYLSKSTVRNHLSAMYRKFGVHSQSELLAVLLRAAMPHDV